MAVVLDIEDCVTSMQRRLGVNMSGIGVINAEDAVYMHRVPGSLTEIRPKAIRPEMVSIGPYHCYNNELKCERSKWWYLNRLLSRSEGRAGSDLRVLFEAATQLEERARSCYDESISAMSKKQFVEMMVLDGCFIIELFRLGGSNEDDQPGLSKPDFPIITRDLLKLENQLPFFVLERLFSLFSHPDDEEDRLQLLALKFFNVSLPRPNEEALTRSSQFRDVKHLLHLFHLSFCNDLERQERQESVTAFRNVATAFQTVVAQAQRGPVNLIRYLASKPLLVVGLSYLLLVFGSGLAFAMAFVLGRKAISLFKMSLFPGTRGLEYHPSSESIQCAAKLRVAGIKFKPLRADNFLVIVFNKFMSRLEIPPITIDDLTISVFINCIALEQCNYQPALSNFTTYIAFISCLVNSSNDVAILSAHGIITSSFLHNDHDIADLFHKLGKKVYFHKKDCYLSQQFRDMEDYYDSPWSNLLRTYFRHPWSVISFLSASILLALSACQTVLSILTYVRHNL